MKDQKAYSLPRGRFSSVEIIETACVGCNTCADICIMDVLEPSPVKGKPPTVIYPEECWFCGCCVDMCPQRAKGAIRVRTPVPMRVSVLRGTSTDKSEEAKPATESV
jgi:formate hydrogenlyase subunit 6/NADH:ubiquinone oxidoreductase subunit I